MPNTPSGKHQSLLLGLLLMIISTGFSNSSSFATEERYLNEIKGSDIYVSQVFSVRDEKYGIDLTSIQENISIDNITTFEINFDAPQYFYAQPFSCTLNFKIYLYENELDTTLITDSITHANINLVVRFDTVTGKSYKAIAMYKFKNARKYGIRVLGITSPELGTIPPIFRVKSEIIINRKYVFENASSGITQYQKLDSGRLLLNWQPSDYPGAELFDLEYTFIDSASVIANSIRNAALEDNDGLYTGIVPDTLDAWFRDNSSRITTSASTYLLNIPYDSGYVLFRIRGVQIHHPDNVRWEGDWNYTATPTDPLCTEDCYLGIVYFNGHEQNLNWQYSVSFAEEGKRKEVISYFDGTLRNRQTVTISNTDDKNIVQETIYDALGRPAMNILPAPTTTNTLHYFKAFNKDSTNNPYSYLGLEFNSCTTRAWPLSTDSGAGRYYSPSNPFQLPIDGFVHARYIPNAFGKPFAVTEYMADNTGRIKAQGGVGPAFQLNGGHDTKYYYGKPSQTELDRLFGTEAGNASHYLKNMVRDANGQLSVSYVDAGGRTIATALAGEASRNLHKLPSEAGALTQMRDELIQPTDLLPDAGDYSLTSTTTFLAPVQGIYKFVYQVDPLKMEKAFGPQKDSLICSHCYYDLVMYVKNDCNIIKDSVKIFSGPLFDTTCATTPGLIHDSIEVDIDEIGEYYVNYRLQISKPALDYYDSVHLVKNSDLKKLNFFLLDELKKTDFFGCFNQCSTCIEALGEKSDFELRFQKMYLADSLVYDSLDAVFVSNLYDSLLVNCQSLQPLCKASVCDEKLELLKIDVSPGGQYAYYDSNYNLLEPTINVLAKRDQVVFFSDEYGIRDSVMLKDIAGEDSLLVDAKALSNEQFIEYFNPKWADSLVRFHPEYCNYLWCVANSESYEFDAEIQKWINADSVKAKGWFSLTAYDTILTKDPFFNGTGKGVSLKEKIREHLQHFSRNYVGTALPDKNILQFIDISLYCKDQEDGWMQCQVDENCRSRNREWALYQQMYLHLKLKYYEEAMRTSEDTVFSNCVNCFIGKDLIQRMPKCVPPDTNSFNITLSDSLHISHPSGTLGKNVLIAITYFADCDTVNQVYGFKGNITDSSYVLPSVGCGIDSISYSIQCDSTKLPYQPFIPPGCSYNCSAGAYNPFDKDSTAIYIAYGNPEELPGSLPSAFTNWQFYPIYKLQTGVASFCQFTNIWVGINDSTQAGWPCPSTSDFFPFLSGETCEHNNTKEVQVDYEGDAIPPGVTVRVNVQYTNGIITYNKLVTFNAASATQLFCSQFTSASGFSATITSVICSGIADTTGNDFVYPPSSCPDNPKSSLYLNKERRYPEYVNLTDYMSELQATGPQQESDEMEQQGATICRGYCEAQADVWMRQLGRCEDISDPVKHAGLKAALIEICAKGCSLDAPFGTSTLPAEVTAAYHSFEEAIEAILGPDAIHDSCAVELIANPYPYGQKPVYTESLITETNYDICNKITVYKNRYLSSGFEGSFHSWLIQYAGEVYHLDSLELDDLLNSCTNCNGLLKNDIVLPAFFEPGTPACLICDSVAAGFTAFFNKFPTMDTTGDDYRAMLPNFMNFRFGYSLSFDQYNSFRQNCDTLEGFTAVLCNKPLMEEIEVRNDGSACVGQLFATALTNAAYRYTVYIDSVRKDFRDAYMTRCMNVRSSVVMEADLFEYHYTLYYYDQSGNLVKTVPPAGVQLLDEEGLADVKRFRMLRNNGCYAYSDSIYMEGYQYGYFLSFPEYLAFQYSAEMMVNLDAAVDHGLFSNLRAAEYPGSGGPLQLSGITASVVDDKLQVELYAMSYGGVQRKAKLVSALSGATLLPLHSWKHLVITKSPYDPEMPAKVYIDGKAVAMEVVTNDLYLGLTWVGGNTVYFGSVVDNPEMTDPLLLTGTIKNFRFYNRELGAMEIRQNAYSFCQTPVSQGGLIFWAPLTNATDAILEDIIGRTTGTFYGAWEAFAGVFPEHGLATTYEYNSLNQVVKQHTPDADESKFFYDRLGRLTASQNKEQKENASYSGAADRYSYTLYDNLGRIKEVGEKSGAEDIGEIDLLDSTVVKDWLASGTDKQITKTIYDAPVSDFQNFLTSRKRVTASVYLENKWDAEGDSTLYNYDILGNVKTLQQHIKALVAVDATNGKKQIDYDYDLVSGKVNKVSYQLGKGDQFMYSYLYDADNRVIESRSSRDGLVWRTDASYRYYLHGPLARTELGHLKSQGVDYAYTLQGWLKGINSDSLNPTYDMAKDGHFSSEYGFARVARDVYGFKLGYFEGDYTAIHNDADAFTYKTYTAPTLLGSGNNLYNGNISNTTIALSKINAGATTGYTYGYDQLNRLVKMRQHFPLGSAWYNTGSIITAYGEDIAYDANGNILKYLRRGSDGQLDMDSLTYHYTYDENGMLLHNKLNHVADQVSAGNYTIDIDEQAEDNYEYDYIGNLKKDVKEGIDEIDWTVYGKIKKIDKASGYGTGEITYGYDPAGNRTSKKLTSSATDTLTYYVRDAQGNVLAIYSKQGSDNLKWNEQHLYGSSRLGVWHWEEDIAAEAPNVTGTSLEDSLHVGSRNYELSNHLGNVLATISDKIIGNDSSGTTNFYLAESLTQQDYYPGGMLQPGRKFDLSSLKYKYGFNGKEMDNEVKGDGNQQDYGARIYDNRLGRFLSIDPLTKDYPWNSTYAFAENSPVKYIDLDGLEKAKPWYEYDFNDFMNFLGSKKWGGWSKGEGIAYEAIDYTNRNLSPVGIVVTNGYVVVKGEDMMTNESSSRIDAAGNLIIAGILHQTGTRIVKPTAATQFRKQMVANSAAMDGLPKPKTSGISLKNSRPQTGGNFGSQSYRLADGKIQLNSRAVTNGTFDFVVTNEGEFIIGQGHYNLSGQASEVKAAGQISLYKGKVTNINNSSGHYQPTVKEASNFGEILKDAGVDVSNARLNLYNGGVKQETIRL